MISKHFFKTLLGFTLILIVGIIGVMVTNHFALKQEGGTSAVVSEPYR